MNIINNLKDKKAQNNKLKNNYGLSVKNSPLGLINLSDQELTNELIDGLTKLPANFVVISKSTQQSKFGNNVINIGKNNINDLPGFDFIVCDDEIKNLNNYLENGVVPIIINNNYMSSILKEFNPIKNEGNSYLYEDANKWSIFYAIVRYLENYKFPQDNKNLVMNVYKI